MFYRPFFTVRGFPKKGPKTGLSIGKKQLPPPWLGGRWQRVGGKGDGGGGGGWRCAGGVLGLKNLVSIYTSVDIYT